MSASSSRSHWAVRAGRGRAWWAMTVDHIFFARAETAAPASPTYRASSTQPCAATTAMSAIRAQFPALRGAAARAAS